jgi:hypothetical protein
LNESLGNETLSGVVDANGQSLAYVYSRDHPHAAHIAGVLTEDEARRIASNIAKLPNLLAKKG